MYPALKQRARARFSKSGLDTMTPAPIDQTTDQKQRRLVIKHQGQFLLLDLKGGMRAQNGAGLGFYINDTRFLSQWEMALGGEELHFLSGDAEEGFAAQLTYSNKAFEDAAGEKVLADSIAVTRCIVVDEAPQATEVVTVQNHGSKPVSTSFTLGFGADFADMFEVRGDKRARRGYLMPTKIARGSITLAYLGLDNILRRTRVSFPGARPTLLESNKATFALQLAPQQSVTIKLRLSAAETLLPPSKKNPQDPTRMVNNHGQRFDFARANRADALSTARRAFDHWSAANARVTTGNADFNRLLTRSYRDIYLLRQRTGKGNAVAAGVPWFAVPFGRDSLIAGLQTLPFMPELSRDVIAFLAQYQGKVFDDHTCEKPGRIMHELRPGEMAALGEIPFKPYYGTVDATQLWLMLLARYVTWTGDLSFARKMWPNVQAALAYMHSEVSDLASAPTIKRFFTYGGTGALTNQGWKDSGNCIVYKNGALAMGPIAVCEVQGYAYAAWREIAAVAAAIGEGEVSANLLNRADNFRAAFTEAFWSPRLKMVVVALDGEGKHCDSVASNAGHLLGTGLLSSEHEKLVVDRLMKDDMFSGWGIRTLAKSEAAYQPMDYQVGAVWPHDNGIIANGMSRIGEGEHAHRVMKAMLDVATSTTDMRLPELFAGYDRGEAAQPVPYQVACVPQLWAAGCAFHMVAGLLGLRFDAAANTLYIVKPELPEWLGHLDVSGLKLGAASENSEAREVSLSFVRNTAGDTTVAIKKTRGNVRCLVEY